MKIVMGNLCNIDEVNNEVYIVVITKRIDDGIKIKKKINIMLTTLLAI
jgi:hypothetical protein